MRVHLSSEAAEVLGECGPFLESDPLRHNVVLTVLAQRVLAPVPSRFWWVSHAGAVVGVAMQSPADFMAAITPMSVEALDALVAAIDADVPPDGLEVVTGPAATAAAFAGRWASVRRVPATPIEAQRLYRCRRVIPAPASGLLRDATPDDSELLIAWFEGFVADTGMPSDGSGDEKVALWLALGLASIWEHDGPASIAITSPPAGGVSRIGFVYTPPHRRRQGYAAAVVAAATARALAGGCRATMLFTQLSNPTSNSVYRSVGYEAVDEFLAYRFG